MAYLIGNTTVITNNGALGSVDGNSLNLATNANIAAGGATYTVANTTTNTDVGGDSAAIIMVTAGGGNANSRGDNTDSCMGSGCGGYTNVTITGVVNTSTLTVGGAAGASNFSGGGYNLNAVAGPSGSTLSAGFWPSNSADGQSGLFGIRGGNGNGGAQGGAPGGALGGGTIWNGAGTPRPDGNAAAQGGGAGASGGNSKNGGRAGGAGRIAVIGMG